MEIKKFVNLILSLLVITALSSCLKEPVVNTPAVAAVVAGPTLALPTETTPGVIATDMDIEYQFADEVSIMFVITNPDPHTTMNGAYYVADPGVPALFIPCEIPGGSTLEITMILHITDPATTKLFASASVRALCYGC